MKADCECGTSFCSLCLKEWGSSHSEDNWAHMKLIRMTVQDLENNFEEIKEISGEHINNPNEVRHKWEECAYFEMHSRYKEWKTCGFKICLKCEKEFLLFHGPFHPFSPWIEKGQEEITDYICIPLIATLFSILVILLCPFIVCYDAFSIWSDDTKNKLNNELRSKYKETVVLWCWVPLLVFIAIFPFMFFMLLLLIICPVVCMWEWVVECKRKWKDEEYKRVEKVEARN